jgi:hypothetical protein
VTIAEVVVVEMMPRDGMPGADGTTYVVVAAEDWPTVLEARTATVSESPDRRFETEQEVVVALDDWH